MRTVLLVVPLITGCDHCVPAHPVVGITVERNSTGYVFRFKNCTNETQVPVVENVRVIRPVPREQVDAAPPICEIVNEAPPVLGTHWRYGEKPPGYKMPVCEPLRPGGTYQIRVFAKGNMTFTLAADGTIANSEPACR